MDICSNCGATLRPGARFCTTCGTRLNATTIDTNQGWGTPRSTSTEDMQETSVFEPVSPPAAEESTMISSANVQREYDRWTSAYSGETKSTDDPASRFISALEDRTTPAEADSGEKEPSGETDPESTWITPPPDAFTAQVTWNYQANTTPAEESTDEGADTSTWRAPSTWNSTEEATDHDVEPVEPESMDGPSGGKPGTTAEAVEVDLETDEESDMDDEQTDAAGFRDGGTDEVDYLSGDENIEISGGETPVLDPDDARIRAIELVDELHRMVRMMPGGGEQDHGAAAMALTEASLNINDFDDVRDAITELQDDPRDIQALTRLATKADKIELLLDEHASLQEAIETALKELNGLG